MIDLTDQRFGALTVVQLKERRSYAGTTLNYWECRCDCGKVVVVGQPNLRRKTELTHGCGCHQGENHRRSRTKEYRSWGKMRRRCLDPKVRNYRYYGGRGVKIHPPWITSFSAFLDDMGLAPGPEYTLDRYPDPAGDYVPGNVRWATQADQNRNRRAA